MRRLLIFVAVAALFGVGLYYALALEPSRIFRGELDAAVKQMPPGYTASYRDAHYSLFSGRAVLHGVTLHHDEPDSLDLAVDQVEIVRPASDFGAAWAKAAAAPAAISPDLALIFGDAVTLTGISYRAAESTMTLAALNVTRPRIYPWALLHPDVPSMAEATASLLARTTPPLFADLAPLFRAEAPWVLGTGYDGYVSDNLEATIFLPPTAASLASEVDYTVRKATSGRYDRGVIVNATVEGISMKSDLVGSIGIDRVAIENFDAKQPFAKLIAGDAASPLLLDGVSIKKLLYGPIAVQTPTGPTMALGVFTFGNIAFAQGMLVSADIECDDLRINKAQMTNLQAVGAFDQLGLDELTASAILAYRWDLARKRISLPNLTLKVKELGTLHLTMELDDAEPGVDLQAKVRLVHTVLSYEDASLADRLLKIAAEKSGAEPAAYREELVAAAVKVTTAPDASPTLVATARAIADFLTAPGRITVELAPPQPIPIMALAAAGTVPPEKLVPLLGLAISANR